MYNIQKLDTSHITYFFWFFFPSFLFLTYPLTNINGTAVFITATALQYMNALQWVAEGAHIECAE